ncbi:MAG TPA: beta-ketoacyl synthase N-terminal-like domain-containing protein, partial [Pararhizobium sp.]|nr:beta-ketoacyl synthase N-terminal-like domain-containing protein [Pararhizobium sp.]
MTAEIIGLAAVAPGAGSADELFRLLDEGRCTVSEIPGDRWDKARYWHPSMGMRGKTYTFAAGLLDDCYAFDPAVFGMSRPEAQLLDPQQRVILQVVWRALEDANIDHADLAEQRVGVYVGASGLDHGNLIVEDPAAAGPYFMTGNTLSIVSNRISHVFSLRGPSLTVDTACSSSLVALDLAFKALEAGEIDLAIVGGVNVLVHPLSYVGFAQARMLSPEGLCRAYDDDGKGYVRAEGGAVVVLRRSDDARYFGDRSHGRIVASGVNSAGRTNGISLPSGEAQLALLNSIYRRDGIDPDDLAFIEGHGTGTRVGDPAEVTSIGMAIGKARPAPIPIGSIKTNIGHAEPASGLLGLVKAVLALKHNRLPASLHFRTPNRSVDFGELNVRVAAEPVDLLAGGRPRLAGVNSFGFGGTNAHVVVGDPELRSGAPPLAGGSGQTFVASAHTEAALRALVRDYAERLDEAAAEDRRKIIAASGVNRHPMRHRFVVNDREAKSIVQELHAYGNGEAPVSAQVAEVVQGTVKTAFVFSGNGSQWAGMGL